MSNENKTPWYKKPLIIIPVVAVILAAIVGAYFNIWLNPPPSDFSITINPMEGAVHQGGVIQTTVTIKGIHGYENSVSLSASDQPSGVVVAFTPPFGGATPAYTSNVMINVGTNVPAGDYIIIIKGTGADGKEHSSKYSLTVKPITVTPTTSTTPTVTTTTIRTFTPINVQDAFYPTGLMGDWGDITFDDSWTGNPYSKPTAIKITYSAVSSQGKGWAGIYWQYPDKNWGDKPESRDLTGATKLTFYARGDKGEEKAEFKVGGITGKYPDSIQPAVSSGVIVLSDKWQQYTIDLKGKDMSHVIGGFVWVANKNQNPLGSTIYLDDIKYE